MSLTLLKSCYHKEDSSIITTVQTPFILDFENLLINNPELDQIGNYLNRFNPIKTMRMEGMEIRHSAILAWLLDPQESYGMGDQFLKAFLAKAYLVIQVNYTPWKSPKQI